MIGVAFQLPLYFLLAAVFSLALTAGLPPETALLAGVCHAVSGAQMEG